jgi:hypothetical protein
MSPNLDRARSVARWTAVAAAASVVAAGGVVWTPQPAAAATAVLTEVGAPFAQVPMATPGQPLLTSGAGEVWSSAAVGDVTGDGRPEIVVGGGLSSQLRVYRTDQSLLQQVDVGGVNTAARRGGIQASPALADLNRDGVLDVTVATTSNVLAAYSLKGGGVSQIWRRHDAPIVPNGPTGMIATPATGYVDGDAHPDVVTASWGQALGASSGTTGAQLPGWPKWLWDSIWSSPAIGDIDGDGVHDVVVGGDCEGNTIGTQPCGSTGGGYVWAFNRDGSEKWRYFLPGQVVWSSPALGDLNGDGAQDVVVGTGGYWAEPAGRRITALDGRTGKVLWTAGTPARVVGSPSLADVTGDGSAEVFVVTHGGYLMSFDGRTGAQRWAAQCITDSGSCGNTQIGTKSGVSLADIDGDGSLEAVTQGEQRLRVYDAATGKLEVAVRSAYKGTIRAPANAPTIASVNGETWIVQPVHGVRDGQHELVVTAWRTGKALGAAPWPTFKANAARTGAAPLPPIDKARTEAFVRELYRDFLGREASSSEVASWTAAFERRQVTRYEVATSLARSDEWIASVITQFYRDTLYREPDAAGLAHWTAAARRGMPVAQIAAHFYASTEYFQKVGRGDHETWVRDLYRKLLLREADRGGLDGWVRALRAGMPRDQLAFGFYQSPETLRVRIDSLYMELLGRPADPAGLSSWAPFVRANGDLVLAAALAASREYYINA